MAAAPQNPAVAFIKDPSVSVMKSYVESKSATWLKDLEEENIVSPGLRNRIWNGMAEEVGEEEKECVLRRRFACLLAPEHSE